jgi:xylulokinase
VTTVLGIDLGTSSVKVVLADPTGRVLAQSTKEYDVARPHPGWAETHPEIWWAAIRAAVADVCGGQPARSVPAGVGLAGQMNGVVLCEESGVPTRPAVLWADSRAEAQLSAYLSLPEERVRRLGSPLSPGMAGPILAWLAHHEPEAIGRACHAVQPKDWIRGRLTGVFRGEPSDASATLLFDVVARDWDREVATRLGIPSELLPELDPHSGAVAGHLLSNVAEELGLPAEIPVAAGAGDTAAAVFGTGLIDIGDIQLTIGTGVQIVTPVMPPTEATLPAQPSSIHLHRAATEDGWYAMAAGLTGGATLSWVKEVLNTTWDELYAAASHPPRLDDPIFVPYLVGERTPHLDTSLRGSWSGLNARHDRNALLYSALEGVAFAVRDGLDALAGVSPGSHPLRLAGGGTTSPAWRQLLSDVLDRSLDAVPTPAVSARGAVLLGSLASGLIPAADLPMVARQTVTRVADPTPRVDLLRERRAAYQSVFSALRTT